VDLVAFYRGQAADYQGRTLSEIWSWDDGRLEDRHDYIQVLFPLPEESRFNTWAPLLDEATLTRFRTDEVIRANLLQSLRVMLRFYGFRLDEKTGEVVGAENFAERAGQWLWPGNHNHLRITRILRCLTLCGLQDQAAAFLKALLALPGQDRITNESRRFWREAVGLGV
jgi:Opioid growth factor receptor (OGFr) conserved region